MHSLCTGVIFGDKAIELCGRVISPDVQSTGLGTELLRRYLQVNPAQTLLTYTRNPAVIAMMKHVCTEVTPIDDDDELTNLAMNVPFSSLRAGVSVHINRYQPGGLFQAEDPAMQPAFDGQSLATHFPVLLNPRNALVVMGRVKEACDE